MVNACNLSNPYLFSDDGALLFENICRKTYLSIKIEMLTIIKWLRGQGGPRPKIIFNVIFVEGRQSHQMLFTGSKNIDPSRIYRIFKIAKYIQLPCGRALYSRLSQNFKF